jgi:ribose transport system substrate-binding protein
MENVMKKVGKLIISLFVLQLLFVGMNSVFAKEWKYAWYAPMPHPYFEEMKKGVFGFAKEFGVEVNAVIGPEWTQSSENANVTALVADGYNLLSVFPADQAGANGLYEEIVRQGAIVANFGASSARPTPAQFYSGTDIPAIAAQAAEAMAKLLNYKGNIILAVGVLGDLNSRICSESARKTLAKYPGINILQEVSDANSVEVAQSKMESAISGNIDKLDGILMTDYTPTVAGVMVLNEYYEKNPGAKHIFTIGRDAEDHRVLDAIRNGVLDGTSSQNAYCMGYMPLLLLKYLSEGWTRKNDAAYNVFSGHMIVTKDNLDTLQDHLVAYVAEVKSKLETEYLNPPK